MKIELLVVGKNTEKYIEDGMMLYLKRLSHYLPVSVSVIQVQSLSNKLTLIERESENILAKITNRDFVILLDERGKEFNSVKLADYFQRLMVGSTTKIIFIIGGAFGVSKSIAERANLVLSFSKFTMTHQMIRIFLLEQIYRAMTIIRNEPYHHS